MPYKNRHAEARLRLLAQNFKVILVTGARQVGKSTILRHLFPDTPIVTFDAHEDIHGAQANPDLFLKNSPCPLILDEIQYAPNLLSAIKRKVDESQAMGQYLLTGSHHIGLMKAVVEGMTGRVGILDLERMSLFEASETISFNDIYQDPPSWLEVYLTGPSSVARNFDGLAASHTVTDALWRGGLPVALEQHNVLVADYFSSYIRTYLERDILYVDPSAASPLFTRFLGSMAARTAQEINETDIMSSLGIKRDTFTKWQHILAQTYQWRELAPYSGNTLKRIVKKGKGHFADSGIAAYLQGIREPLTLLTHPSNGALFESYCVNSIFQMMSGMYSRPMVYHWRTYGGAEVDIVLDINGKLYPIETKFGTSLSKHDARGIMAFRETYGEQVQHGLILYPGNSAYQLSEQVTVLPFNALMKKGSR